MFETPQLIQTTAQHIAVIHLTVPRSQIQHVMGPGLAELKETVAAQGIEVTGPWFTHHLKMHPDIFDFEIGIPVKAPVVAAGRVKPSQFPAQRVVRTTYRGPYEGLGPAWGEFLAWVDAHGHKQADDLWEVYVSGPESSPNPADWHTQFNKPVLG